MINGLQWSAGEEEGSDGTFGENGGRIEEQESNWRTGQVWTTTLAPRFERKAAAEAEYAKNSVYYDGELCEAVELPNGFTKIRSKNLDILFKRDYYEQRMVGHKMESTEEGEDDVSETTDEDETMNEDSAGDTGENETKDEKNNEGSDESNGSNDTTPTNPKSFYQMDPSAIPEFKPMNRNNDSETVAGGPPFYPPQYNQYGEPHYPGHHMATPARPNLYLYSPSSNALIPCEEIIIPNPVMGPDGPCYSGPTNIYLAYPINGPDGRGYITQPLAPALPHVNGEYVQYNQSYSPTHSMDGSVYPSSSPNTPNSANSGMNSGTSTLPSTPPPMLNYHPTNWVATEQQPTVVLNKPSDKRPNLNSQPAAPMSPYVDPYLPSSETSSMTESTSPIPSPNVDASQPAPPPSSIGVNGINANARPFIPGLPPETNAPKKTQRRKKKKRPIEIAEHRGSTSSETDLIRNAMKVSDSIEDEGVMEKDEGEDIELVCYEPEPLQEVTLSDALAESLVNPPTDEEDGEVLDEKKEEEVMVTNENDKNDDCDNTIENTVINIEERVHTENNQNIEDTSRNSQETIHCSEQPEEMDEVKNFNNKIKSEKPMEMELTNKPILSIDMPSAIKDTVKNDEITKTETVDDIKVSDVVATSHAGNNNSSASNNNEAELLNAEDQRASQGNENPDKVEQTVNMEAFEDVPGEHFAQDDVVPDPQPERASKRKNVKKNRSKKMVLQKEKIIHSPIIIANLDTPEDLSKKLYSAVCKPTEPAFPVQVHPLKIEPDQIKEEKPSSSVENTIVQPPQPPPQQQQQQQGDQWESVPLAVSKPTGWEQNSSKRKNRKKRNNNIVHFEDEVTAAPEEVAEKIESLKKERVEAVEPTKDDKTPVVTGEPEAAKEEDEEKEEEKKKNKKRKKRHTSEEADASAHRVIISDNLVEIRLTRPVRRAEEILTPPQLQRASLSGHLDFVLISELGCGMNKGSMNYDRLYKGKYIPPERTDGIPEEEEEARDEDAEDVSETVQLLPKEDVDIDLD